MIAFKLFAAADHHGDIANKHLGDLVLIAPAGDELSAASDWCQLHDPSPGFATLLNATLAELERRRAH